MIYCSLEGVGDPFPTHWKLLCTSSCLPCTVKETLGGKKFYAKLPLVEFDITLCKVFFGLRKIIEEVVSSILSWLRRVLDLPSCSSICDAIKQEILLTTSCPFFRVLWKFKRIGFVQAGERFSEAEKKALSERNLQEGWRETIYKGL